MRFDILDFLGLGKNCEQVIVCKEVETREDGSLRLEILLKTSLYKL